MDPIQATFEVVKVKEDTWDVIILSEDAVLKSFLKVYENLFYIEDSVFDNKPIVIAPSFPDSINAESWKEYWVLAFSDPDNACKTCPTVNELLKRIEQSRKKSS